MHYFSFHIRDYRSKTGYLTRMQNLAYRLLLEECYMTERPLPSDPAECARKIGMSDCVDDVRLVLNDFFELGEDGYRNRRCEEELSNCIERQEKKRRAGMASGEARRARAERLKQGTQSDVRTGTASRNERMLNAHSTDDEQPLNICSTRVELPNTHYPLPKTHLTPPVPPLGGLGSVTSFDVDPVAGPEGAVSSGTSQPSAALPDSARQRHARARSGPESWSGVHVERPGEVSVALWRDFCVLRKAKRAPITEAALAGIRREAGKAGVTLSDALAFMAERGHQGFIVDAYLRRDGPSPSRRGAPARLQHTPHSGFSELDYRQEVNEDGTLAQ